MEVKKITKQEPYGYTRHIEQVVNHNAEVLESALNRIKELEKTKLSALRPVAPTQNWIPVSERLPKKGVEVLATTEWGEVTIAMYCVTDWFIHEGDTNAETDEIIAWMPLPQPYKGEKENKECENCHYNDGEPHAECVVCEKAAGKDTKDKVIAEIDKQGEWLVEAGYNAYNVDVAFGSIIRALRKMC